MTKKLVSTNPVTNCGFQETAPTNSLFFFHCLTITFQSKDFFFFLVIALLRYNSYNLPIYNSMVSALVLSSCAAEISQFFSAWVMTLDFKISALGKHG